MTERETRSEGKAESTLEPTADAEARWSAAMAAAQRGDASAYRKLLEELLPVVRRLVRARLYDASMAEDVVQNALLSIHRARHTYRPERPLGPWMRAIVRNATFDALRQQKRRRERELPVEAIDRLVDSASEAATESARELSPELASALAALPEKQRQAVELIQVHGFSVAQAALREKVSPGALKVRAHRGYRAMRARLEKEK